MFFSRSLFSCLPSLQLAGNAKERRDVCRLFGTLQVREVAGITRGNPRSSGESVIRPAKKTTAESPAVFKRAE